VPLGAAANAAGTFTFASGLGAGATPGIFWKIDDTTPRGRLPFGIQHKYSGRPPLARTAYLDRPSHAWASQNLPQSATIATPCDRSSR